MDKEDPLLSTKEESAAIKRIEAEEIHKICSGQVIVTLAVAVKELVENALDAGAKCIEVKLKNRGLDAVEISDDGCGVKPNEIESMTAKYYTSKIREFVDVQTVQTFGFRGEALSSLCSLADMQIITRHKEHQEAVKIDLDHKGNVIKKVMCSRECGTTITLQKLFHAIPVRRRDFERNIKREFIKMCHILQAYCLVSIQTRFRCSNQMPDGKSSIIMMTQGNNSTVLNNIYSIFGKPKSNQRDDSLLVLKSPLENDNGVRLNANELWSVLQEYIGDNNQQLCMDDLLAIYEQQQFQLDGYISSCAHGCGRSSKDRQYYYVNSRPCDLKNVAKVINDCYHSYNAQQYPFVYLNILTNRQEVDVNLTPDKRQLLLTNEKLLLALIKRSLHMTFNQIPATYKLQNTTITNMMIAMKKEETAEMATTTTTTTTTTTIPSTATTVAISSNIQSSVAAPIITTSITTMNKMHEENVETSKDFAMNDLDKCDLLPMSTVEKFRNVLAQWKRTGNTIGKISHIKKRKYTDELQESTMRLQKIQKYLQNDADQQYQDKLYTYKSDESNDEFDADDVNSNSNLINTNNKAQNSNISNSFNIKEEKLTELADFKETKNDTDKASAGTVSNSKDLIFINAKTVLKENVYDDDDGIPEVQLDGNDDDNDNDDKTVECKGFACSELSITLKEIEDLMKAEDECKANQKKQKQEQQKRLRFKSSIKPSENKTAETELQKEFHKDDFLHMNVLGQFNLGFIICQLDEDLFIVDQHATDEKYNYEMLQRNTQIQHQPLTVPQPLELTAINEMTLIDHIDTFEKNGFKFSIDHNAPPCKKIRLLGKPFSQNWEFGKSDIDELIFMLQDAPDGTLCRPSRVNAMFASRACRQSIMIGTALNVATMERVIRHMSEMEHPWNCPHGRPTMRHLINTALLTNVDNSDDDE